MKATYAKSNNSNQINEDNFDSLDDVVEAFRALYGDITFDIEISGSGSQPSVTISYGP